MKQQLDKIEGKIDSLTEKVATIDKNVAVNTADLKTHIEGVKQTRELIDLKETEMNERLNPIEKKIQLIDALVKIAVCLGGLAGFVYCVVEVIRFYQGK